MITNYVCEKCGGRWLPKTPISLPGVCPWCEIARLIVALEKIRRDYEQHVTDTLSVVRAAMGLAETAAKKLPTSRAGEWLHVLGVLKRAMERDAAMPGHLDVEEFYVDEKAAEAAGGGE